MSETLKHFIDGLSITGTLAAIVGFVPALTAVLTLVWTCIRIYETKSVQRMLGKKGPANE
jgi:hypothetical protein